MKQRGTVTIIVSEDAPVVAEGRLLPGLEYTAVEQRGAYYVPMEMEDGEPVVVFPEEIAEVW